MIINIHLAVILSSTLSVVHTLSAGDRYSEDHRCGGVSRWGGGGQLGHSVQEPAHVEALGVYVTVGGEYDPHSVGGGVDEGVPLHVSR